jgi:hypothetical protein
MNKNSKSKTKLHQEALAQRKRVIAAAYDRRQVERWQQLKNRATAS